MAWCGSGVARGSHHGGEWRVPFDFETLATYTYQFAKDEMLEAAALPALMIVVAGLVPVILMNSMLRRAG